MSKILKRVMLGLLVVAVVFFIIWGYVLPRWTGEQFIRHLTAIEIAEAENLVCEDSSLGQTLGSWNQGLSQLDAALAQVFGANVPFPGREALGQALVIETSSYNPLNGVYSATLKLGGAIQIAGISFGADVSSSPIDLRILRAGILTTCIAPAT